MQFSNSPRSNRLRIAVVAIVCIAGPSFVAWSQPAARVGDGHICPLVIPVPHVGGPILGPGVPTVLIGGSPAAVIGTLATCNGPPDTIVSGEPTVLIGGVPAARLGDATAHGGQIVGGAATVLIGGTSKSGNAAGDELGEQVEILERALEDVGEDEAIRNALATTLRMIGDRHTADGDEAAARRAYAEALAAIEPAVATAERNSVLVTYVQTLVLNGRIADAGRPVAELERRGFEDPHFSAYCEHHGIGIIGGD